jgi:hexulose-6-phosphate isomerase
MKKGISIWSFPNPDVERVFELAKKAGFDGVEVSLAEDGEINLKSTEKDALSVKSAAANAGIELYSLASGLYWKYNYTSENTRDKAKDITKKQLELARLLGCDTILVVPGVVCADFVADCPVVNYQTAYDRALETLIELAPFAKEAEVIIGVENVWNKFLLSPLEMRDFIDKAANPYICAYFDVGNTLLTGYPEHWIDILGGRIKKVHLKDYRRAAPGLSGFVDLLEGDVDYPEVMRALKRIGYSNWLTAEMLPPYSHYPEALIYNTSKAMDYIMEGQ